MWFVLIIVLGFIYLAISESAKKKKNDESFKKLFFIDDDIKTYIWDPAEVVQVNDATDEITGYFEKIIDSAGAMTYHFRLTKPRILTQGGDKVVDWKIGERAILVDFYVIGKPSNFSNLMEKICIGDEIKITYLGHGSGCLDQKGKFISIFDVIIKIMELHTKSDPNNKIKVTEKEVNSFISKNITPKTIDTKDNDFRYFNLYEVQKYNRKNNQWIKVGQDLRDRLSPRFLTPSGPPSWAK